MNYLSVNLKSFLILVLISFSIAAKAGGGAALIDIPIAVSSDAYCQGKNVSFRSFRLLTAPYVFLATGQVGGQTIHETVYISYDLENQEITIMPYDINTNSYNMSWSLFNDPSETTQFSFGIEENDPNKNELKIIENSINCYGLSNIQR